MIDRADLEQFARTLRRAVASHGGPALDAVLADVGWREVLAVDARAAVATLFEVLGEANAASSALDQLLSDALGCEAGPPTGVVLPALGRWHAPGVLDGRRVAVGGVATAGIVACASTVVVAASGDTHVAVAVATRDLALRPAQGLDPELGLVEVSGDAACADPPPRPVDWPRALARARLAVGHELVGGSRKMLALAREHALQRIQFGRPIAGFQAVRHRLADTLVAIETAEAVLAAAWEDGSPEVAAMAKALAGRGARTTVRNCQQVLAGIGFTTEHPLHRYVRRALVLDQLLGSARALTQDLGTTLLRTRQLPPLLPL